MQQPSKASVKMQAHRDNIINQVAMTTKRRFILDQINYLTDFKEQLEVLNQIAKPSANPSLQISKISKKIEKTFLNNLQEEILFTRREISLQEINDDLNLQTKIAQNYQEKIEQYARKLEHMEAIVQQSEERRKSKEKVDFSNSGLSFKAFETKRAVEQFISQKEKIKRLLRDRLILSGRIIKLQQRQKHKLTTSTMNHHKYSSYHFLASHQSLYRNKSRQRGQLETKTTLSKHNMIQKYKYPIRKPLLECFQKEAFLQELDAIKNYNNKLQILIFSLKNAVSQRQDEKWLQQLNKNKNLARQQTIARQIFAFQKLSQRFQQKLEKCSYKWVFQSKLNLPRAGSKEESWEAERLASNRNSFIIKNRPKSTGKHCLTQTIQFLPAEASKSNMKTNCSLQALQH